MKKESKAIALHRKLGGKYEIKPRSKVTKESLPLLYTPGVAEACLEIHQNPHEVYNLTRKSNTVAVITDGTAILGLGDIGPEAGLPVMEGKAILFKAFGNVDAIPILLNTKDTDEIVQTIINIAPSFGGINLEDIAAPRCFEIERRLKDALDIPIFHDDQHGTAVVTSAAVINILRLTKKTKDNFKIVINGAGAAGIAIAKLLLELGFKEIILCDKSGILHPKNNINPAKMEIHDLTNPNKVEGMLVDAIKKADLFIGVSAGNVLTTEMVKLMNEKSAILAMANPIPEIHPDIAKAAGAYIVGTGRSDFPNQINNLSVFPGIFRAALDTRSTTINNEMMTAAANALAYSITDSELNPEYIIPSAFDLEAHKKLIEAVKQAAMSSGVARL
ncbi:MAG: NAD(P)-dependent malic enzyme [Acholeplasmataceae bacterium]|jgi:malate dehydrogenase (oxaloacetate-decarboxylating)